MDPAVTHRVSGRREASILFLTNVCAAPSVKSRATEGLVTLMMLQPIPRRDETWAQSRAEE